ncbi:Translationally-controlled tumor protein [Aspergillus caelatus]|uniref:Translationally-controlled tumor protein homolog n=1 Tax=Aspergillus caelatus TaxID=61420 RepID=A0A5N6ZRN7_9EURO|nr:Translationally-controlled tumor protein [Aspergillus caelatus]KAE8358850.1 Translationally-controlled tumor protein [Aspergillus caelatus]
MRLFTDVISDDEMFSDKFPIKEVDDIVYEVDCALIEITRGPVEIGTDPSAEEQEEAPEDNTVTVNNVVHSFHLRPTNFDKKTYIMHLKGYMRAIRKHLEKTNPSRAHEFEQCASQYAKKIVANFRSFEFYTGGSMNGEAMVALLNYRDDGETPFFTFWKDGLDVVDY